MAKEKKFNTDEEDDTALSSQGGAPGASSASGATVAPRPSTPSGRPNVQQYLNANQGAGDKLAGGIQSGFEKQVGSFDKAINTSKTDLSNAANPLEQNLGDAGSNKIKTAFKDPQAILSDQNQLAEFKKLQNQGYNANISGIQDNFTGQKQQLQNQYGALDQQAKDATTESGRFNLLRSTFGQPNYSQGQQKLDQLFLQAQPGANRSLQTNLKTGVNQASQGLQGLDAESQARLSALTKLSSDRATQASNLIKGGNEAGLEADISGRGLDDIGVSSQNRLASAQTSVADVPALRDRLKNNKLTNADLQALGLSSGTQLYDTDLSQFISQSDKIPTLAGAADPAEVARYRALQQLAGDTSGDIFGGAETVGDFKPYDYRNEDLTSSIAQRQKYFEQEKPKDLLEQLTKQYGKDFSGGPVKDNAAYAFARDLQALNTDNLNLYGQPSSNLSESIQRAIEMYATRAGQEDKQNHSKDQWLEHFRTGGNLGGNGDVNTSSVAQALAFLNQYNSGKNRTIQPIPDDLEETGIITS